MTETASAASSAELAFITRDGFVESRHSGSVAVVDPAGELIYSFGAPEELVLPRSAMKPFIATAIMASGVELEGAQAAIATSSHSGSEQHALLVRELLKRAGLGDDALQCPRDMPHDKALRTLMIRRDIGPSPLFHCCSGKHAAMLLACVVNQWPTETYLELDHPLQQRVIEVMQRLIGTEITVSAVDGCGAPVHAMSLLSLARGVRTLVSSSLNSPFAMFRSGAELTQAMLANPVVVGASGEPDTVLMQKLGVVAKTGYEGIFVASTADGTTAAVKVLDGNLRAAALIAITALVRADALTQAQVDSVAGDLDLTIYGGGAPVGAIQVAF